MVWIHGGGNTEGQGDIYDGGVLATKENVIVVTINYRLGIFGWFVHPALRGDATSAQDRSGNYGTLDQIHALRWVKDNIAVFGGNPGNVTVFGQSAGGAAGLALLSSENAAGLFQRAIIQSGYVYMSGVARSENLIDDRVPGTPRSSGEVLLRLLIDEGRAKDRYAAKAYAVKMGSGAVATYLRSKTYAEFMRAYAQLPDTDPEMLYDMGIPQVFRDGIVLPADGILAAFARGAYNKIPVLIGGTRNEFGSLLAAYGGKVAFAQIDPATSTIKVPDKRRYAVAAEYASLFMRANNVDAAADLLVLRQKRSIFVYRFDWADLAPDPASGNVLLGASHTLDVPFVFGHRFSVPYIPDFLIRENSLSSYRTLSNAMMSYWTQFAVSGDPEKGRNGDLPRWDSWESLATTKSDAPGAIIVFDGKKRGGIRTLSSRTSQAQVLARLEKDPRFTSLASSCQFLGDLMAIRGLLLTAADYNQFANGTCSKRLAPANP